MEALPFSRLKFNDVSEKGSNGQFGDGHGGLKGPFLGMAGGLLRSRTAKWSYLV
jgi:hypothetical protein